MKSNSRFAVLCLLAMALPALASPAAQKKNYYYHPVTKDSYQHSSNEAWRDEDGDGVNDARQRNVPQRTRYHYTPVYRDRHLYSPYRYQPAVRYPQPPGHQSGSWWGVGNRLPAAYYAPKYVIDYRRYRLPPPSEGQRWVRVENDVYLVNSASGQIRDALYQLFY
jgi:Ni/Co efflux regulator RcnB